MKIKEVIIMENNNNNAKGDGRTEIEDSIKIIMNELIDDKTK